MDRAYFLDLAARGLAMPLGPDLVLHRRANAHAVRTDGRTLGQTVVAAAREFGTPLAVPLMDLTVEKQALAAALGVAVPSADTFHFDEAPDASRLEEVVARVVAHPTARMQANLEALAVVAGESDLVPLAMCIGPFSLMTKLLEDPITAVYLTAKGLEPDEADEVGLFLQTMELATRSVCAYARMQFQAGARALIVAEPAPSKVYLSPKQMEAAPEVFERCVLSYNRRLREVVREAGAELIFHCCGDLVDAMVAGFGTLDAAVLSLGGSRVLWEDARLVPRSTVLFGNLPSKKFYSDEEITYEQVQALSRTLRERMATTGHPFILGTECDVLAVPGREAVILAKVRAMLDA